MPLSESINWSANCIEGRRRAFHVEAAASMALRRRFLRFDNVAQAELKNPSKSWWYFRMSGAVNVQKKGGIRRRAGAIWRIVRLRRAHGDKSLRWEVCFYLCLMFFLGCLESSIGARISLPWTGDVETQSFYSHTAPHVSVTRSLLEIWSSLCIRNRFIDSGNKFHVISHDKSTVIQSTLKFRLHMNSQMQNRRDDSWEQRKKMENRKRDFLEWLFPR